MIKLIITLPDGSQLPMSSELLDQRVTVGSGVDSTIVVPHESVAETHLELLLDGSGYLVADLVGGGTTSINGHAIEPGVHYQLETGTNIQLGEVEAVYIASDSSAAEGTTGTGHTESEPEGQFASNPHSMSGVFAGSASLPVHPPGVFVPRKPERSLWVIASVAVTFVAVAAAAAAAFLSAGTGGQH